MMARLHSMRRSHPAFPGVEENCDENDVLALRELSDGEDCVCCDHQGSPSGETSTPHLPPVRENSRDATRRPPVGP